ncbi:Adenylate cyclase, class 3 [Tistlia consotensis]|uniref:Adenylate cyclase, class 3 n=1 Tax=Tistlia consotensis USBA 355 TaxID=560819 RepID=A0A1Y6C267_9PROT|nr:adenylate/guanylate cyclase domain-containing protein [Tistlia consotensis]SMF41535.1 Adenylate cyclase, class 3 [Tistlia consotensis USBA 355]SNR73650.1 Adenylate cyclase, class 3 [Tistlia consotensis]
MTSPRDGSGEAGVGSFVAILDALAFAAGRIGTLGPWQRDIQELLARLGRAAAVSRVTLFEVHEDGEGRPVESCRFDWAEPGLAPLSGDPRYRSMPIWDASGRGLEDWSLRRSRGEILQVRLSETSGYDRKVFEEQGTFSFLSVPIFVEGRYWGFLGFDDCRAERGWSPLEIKVLEIAAALIGGAVARARAQRDLRLSQQRHALAALGADDGLWEWDPPEGTAFLSRRCRRILGLVAGGDGEIFAELSRRLQPSRGGDLDGFFAACFAERRRSFEVECRLVAPEGPTAGAARWIVLRGVILYAVGRPQRVVGSLRDISDRKRTQLELERKEHLLRAVVDSVPALINVKDRQSRYLLMNRYQGEVYGIDPQAAIGLTSSDIVGAAYGDRSRELDLEVLAAGRPQPFSERDFVDVSGRPRTWYTAKMPLLGGAPDEGGTAEAVEGVITVALDVTALKAERRARAQLSRFVAPALVDLVAAADEPFGPPRQQTAAVLFADLVGFTGLAERWPPHVVFALLREFHDHGARAVFDTGGTLTKFTGDGFMATFGLPRSSASDAGNALACARALSAAVDSFNAWREVAQLPVARVAIGVHVGPLLIGALGSDKRTEIAVIGDTVNVASRLEGLVRSTGGAIAISEALAEAVAAGVGEATAARLLDGFEPLPPQRLRGRSEAVGVRIFPGPPATAAVTAAGRVPLPDHPDAPPEPPPEPTA